MCHQIGVDMCHQIGVDILHFIRTARIREYSFKDMAVELSNNMGQNRMLWCLMWLTKNIQDQEQDKALLIILNIQQYLHQCGVFSKAVYPE